VPVIAKIGLYSANALVRVVLNMRLINPGIHMKTGIIQIIALSLPLFLPPSGSGAELGTRQRTITPVAVTNAPVPPIFPSAVSNYAVYGYSSWQWGPGEDEGQQLTNMPAGYPGATNAARLLAFLSISDAHITDKESPCQSIDLSYQGTNGSMSACYSPVMLYTTQVLDAGVRTANALNRLLPFDFAISLGDDANGPQHNELRWYIDVLDGKYITPSSGDHAGATNIDYQEPFQAAGLDPAIPWYAVLGNHDQFWQGGGLVPEFQTAFTNATILKIGDDFMGTIDGTTPYGNVIGAGPVTNYVVNGVTNAPTVEPDPSRYGLSSSNWMQEFFNTSSQPVGHGFSRANITNDFLCYSFEPKPNLPLKVIVLDDTMTDQDYDPKGQAGLDTHQLAWLVNELNKGQTHDQLMIIAAHEPIEDFDMPGSTNSVISSTNLLILLHTYPNLLLWICGHTHQNNITPQPSPDTNSPEYGFWEVQTASLRDFPQEFRAWEILRNTDKSISFRVTDIDPEETTNSPAAVSRGYAIGAARIFMTPCTSLADTNSYAHNAELLKLLTPPMQAKIANCGGPLGHNVAIDCNATGVAISFLGELQSADNILGPWNDVANTSPYTVSATNAASFYRATE
jgi:metallophosphoesterase (TIGR03768 family)